MYFPCCENKVADQLRSYREADLRLFFRIYAKSRFSHDPAQGTNGCSINQLVMFIFAMRFCTINFDTVFSVVSVCCVNNVRENSQKQSVAYFCIIISIVSLIIVLYESFTVISTCNKSEACLYYLHILSACTHRIPAATQR